MSVAGSSGSPVVMRVHARRERVDDRVVRPTTRRRRASPPCSPGRCCRWRRAPPPTRLRRDRHRRTPTIGALPPSSSCTGIVRSAASCMMRRPVADDPVNDAMSTPVAVSSASPTSAPPVTTENALSGRPASIANSARRIADRGVAGAGLSTTVHPAASAAPDLPDRHHERKVPRRDRGDDADRPAEQHRRVAGAELAGRGAVQRAGGGREEPEVVDRERQLTVAHHRPWLAGLLDLQPRQLVGVLLHQIGEPVQDERPLRRQRPSPLGAGLGGGRHLGTHLARRGIGDRVDRAAPVAGLTRVRNIAPTSTRPDVRHASREGRT